MVSACDTQKNGTTMALSAAQFRQVLPTMLVSATVGGLAASLVHKGMMAAGDYDKKHGTARSVIVGIPLTVGIFAGAIGGTHAVMDPTSRPINGLRHVGLGVAAALTGAALVGLGAAVYNGWTPNK